MGVFSGDIVTLTSDVPAPRGGGWERGIVEKTRTPGDEYSYHALGPTALPSYYLADVIFVVPRGLLIADRAGAIGRAVSTRTRFERICVRRPLPVDWLRVIGHAHQPLDCVDTLGLPEQAPFGRAGWLDFPDRLHDEGAMTKWVAEMKALQRELQLVQNPQHRQRLEARAVKLDHLLSIYGSTR
jgi:hypothetical protein